MTLAGTVNWQRLQRCAEGSGLPRVIVDGILFDLTELRRHAGAPADADTATIIAYGVRSRGLSFLDRLSGDYALAIIEPAGTRLHLVRDATGQRPLFFSRTSAEVRFASLPSGLGLPLHADFATLALMVSGMGDDRRETALAGVARLLPGEIATFTPEGVSFQRWWKPMAEATSLEPTRPYSAEYRDLLQEAVRRRSGSMDVACHLSGGWDSSAVTSAAAAVLGRTRVQAFTAAPLAPVDGALMRHSLADESAQARETASFIGVPHQTVRARYDPFALARWFSEVAQAPLLAPFQIGWWNAIRDAARQSGVKLLLTGELGNLSLNAGGLPMLSALGRSGRWPKALKESRLLVRRGAIRWRGAAAAVLHDRLPDPLYAWLRQQLASGPPTRPRLFLRREVAPSERVVSAAGTHGQRLAAIQQSDFGVQRIIAEQRWGLSEMDPTADRALLEWSLSLPVEALLRDGVTRPIAREALREWVPATVLDNRHRGLQGADWYQLVSASDCRAVLAEIRETPLVRDFLDIAGIEQAISQWPSSDWNSSQNYARFRLGLVNALGAGLFVSRFAP